MVGGARQLKAAEAFLFPAGGKHHQITASGSGQNPAAGKNWRRPTGIVIGEGTGKQSTLMRR